MNRRGVLIEQSPGRKNGCGIVDAIDRTQFLFDGFDRLFDLGGDGDIGCNGLNVVKAHGRVCKSRRIHVEGCNRNPVRGQVAGSQLPHAASPTRDERDLPENAIVISLSAGRNMNLRSFAQVRDQRP